MSTRKNDIKKQEAIECLKRWVKPGDTLYTILRHVSRSGMFRRITVKKIECIDGEAQIAHLDYNVARALGISTNKINDGVPVSGCGMDMGYGLVYDLSYVLFGNGYECLGDRCPSADHSNREPKPDGTWIHKDGYALRQQWL